MSSQAKSRIIRYAVTFAAGGVLAYVYVSLRDFGAQELSQKFRILCDAFTVPGALLLLVGALMSISGTGALDGVGYVSGQALGMFIPGRGLGWESYADYVERKREKRGRKGHGFLYISGAVFMAIALVFLILFYCV